MRVLMLSIDKGLLGRGQLGDVVERHRKYGEHCERLDIIVFCRSGFAVNQISDKVSVYPTNSFSKLGYFFAGRKLGRKLFSDNQYDLIVAQEPFVTALVGCSLKKRFEAKLLVHFHGDFWQNPGWLKENWLNFFLRMLSKYTIKCVDAARVMSEGQKGKLIKGGVAARKIRVISTPVEVEKYERLGLETAKQVNQSRPVILHVGRDDRVKDYDTLVKAFKIIKVNLPETSFIQAGADRIIKEAMQKNNFQDIDLKYHLSHNDLINLYYLAWVAVLSSTSESFGKVLVEANACGKPVVSTATTGAKEIIQDGYNGFLVPIGDAPALAEKVLYLLNNPWRAQEMGENGRRLVRGRFNGKINIEKIIGFWYDIINNKL